MEALMIQYATAIKSSVFAAIIVCVVLAVS